MQEARAGASASSPHNNKDSEVDHQSFEGHSEDGAPDTEQQEEEHPAPSRGGRRRHT